MSAGGTDGQEPDSPNANVEQNVDGLFEKYRDDSRVSYAVFSQAFNDIKITVDGEEHTVKSSGNVPVGNGLLAGAMPMGDGSEVAVPKSFVRVLGLDNGQILAKELAFQATVYNWESGEPVVAPVEVTAKIVGVVNDEVVTEFQGEFHTYTVEDSFFFSPAALKEMRERADMKSEPGNFYLRAKTPEDLISLKDELNAAGIVPLGRFELVEDMVRLNQQTSRQSGSAVTVIAALAILAAAAVAVLNAALRRREYAIFKVSGYSAGQLALASLAEAALLATGTAVVFLCVSPLLNLATTALWNVNILNGKLLATGVLLTLGVGVLSWAAEAAVAGSAKAANALKTGDR